MVSQVQAGILDVWIWTARHSSLALPCQQKVLMIHLIFTLFSMIIRHKHFTHHICIPTIPAFIWRQGSLHSTHPLQQLHIHNVWPWKRWKGSWKGWRQCHRKTLCDNIQGQFDTNQCCCCDSHPLQVSQSPLFIVLFTMVVSSIFPVLSMRRPVVSWRSFRGMWVTPLFTILFCHLTSPQVNCDSITYTEHAKRKTVTSLDVVYAPKWSVCMFYS